MSSVNLQELRGFTTAARPRSAAATSKGLRAIHAWSTIGGFWMLTMTYVFASWLLSGSLHPTPTGLTPVPDSIRINAIFWQVFLGALSLWLFYYFVVREWRREHRLTLNGMLWIAAQSIWWQDALLNYFSPVFSYNSILVNWGSWNAFVPGWMSANAEKMPSPILLYVGMYPVFFCGAVVAVVNLMKKAKNRWPDVSDARLVLSMYGLLGLFAVIAESLWLRAGLYTYTGVYSPITWWADQAYKVPVTQVFFLDAAVLTGLASLLYFRDDRGETFVEKGVDQLSVGRGAQSALRLLAVIGAANTILFVAYNIPMNYLAIRGQGWAASVLDKSYFTNGVCGDGSDYACPGGAVPIPIGHLAMHIAPDGSLIMPAGVSPPKNIATQH
jgi:hypothetical protein